MKGFVFLDISEDQLPVLVRVKSETRKTLYFSFLMGKEGIYARKVDRDFREKRDELMWGEKIIS